ncbi:uncharacterized protein BJ212DRAFT_1479974 [Suillus subaureus]|uniref:HAT C-terminal dimerisation domain-containing protein n=1 Tax=Suillus subaureus TaxID=48587 RepID=A0A9P7EDT7_9AGAM|nr:uncharacterized protein BJ212DRAFT_1479974 [Suillus subaureus]KAG1818147.1 hypothetical protein BJ212DRAFT_1479974 [Suillus subaureus]
MPLQLDAPALNPDRSLKNAEEMEWVHSPTSEPASLTLKIPARNSSSVPCERAFSDAGLTDTKRRARLLPANFGDIQIVKNKYKKERRHHEAEMEAKDAARRQRWLDDAVDEVQLGAK